MRDLLIRLVARFRHRPCCYMHFNWWPCWAEAEWMLVEPGPPADSFTDACTRHVGALLTDNWPISVNPIHVGRWEITEPMR